MGETAFPQEEEERAGADKRIMVPGSLIDFDDNLFWRITFPYRAPLPSPLTAFPEAWRNFPAIDGVELRQEMTRTAFGEYLERWQRGAAGVGKRLNVDYWVREFVSGGGTNLVITFAPRRRLYGMNELAGDAWTFGFSGGLDAKSDLPGRLISVTAACDAFSTRGRPPSGQAQPKPAPVAADAPPGPTLVDGTHLYFGQDLGDAEEQMGMSAVDGPRRGIEKEIRLTTLAIGFDRGRAARFRFMGNKTQPDVFAEAWKNLSPIGDKSVSVPMTGTEFEIYLSAWVNRAGAAGQERGRSFDIQEFVRGQAKVLRLTMASAERDGGRPDEWLVSLALVREDHWQLLSLEAISGAHHTRPLPANERRLEEVRRASEKMPLPLPSIELPKPGSLPPLR